MNSQIRWAVAYVFANSIHGSQSLGESKIMASLVMVMMLVILGVVNRGDYYVDWISLIFRKLRD